MDQHEGAGHHAVTRQAVKELFASGRADASGRIDGMTETQYFQALDKAQEYQDRWYGPTIRPAWLDGHAQTEHGMADPSHDGAWNLAADRSYVQDQLAQAHQNAADRMQYLGNASHALEDSYSQAHAWRGDAANTGDPTAPVTSFNVFDPLPNPGMRSIGVFDGVMGTHDHRFDEVPVDANGNLIHGSDQAAAHATAQMLMAFHDNQHRPLDQATTAMNQTVGRFYQAGPGGVAVNTAQTDAWKLERDQRVAEQRSEESAARINSGQLVVDYDALANMAQELLKVKTGFDNVEGATKAAGEYLGSGRVSDAVESFGKNWSDKRQEISTLIQQVADAAADAAATYRTTEDGIVKAEQKMMDSIPGSGGSNGTSGTPPTMQKPIDTDGDGMPDYRDTDSDNDGIPDSVESGMGGGTGGTGTGTPGATTPGGAIPGGTTPGGTVPGGTTPGGTVPGGTTPGSTIPGGTTPGGTIPGGSTPGGAIPGGSNVPIDTDGDGMPDYRDTDSDNDGIPDRVEQPTPITTQPGGVTPGSGQPIGGIDPLTGQPVGSTGGIDPLTGQPIGGTGGIDPLTGQPVGGTGGIDPVTGQPIGGSIGGIDPITGQPIGGSTGGIDPITGQPVGGGTPPFPDMTNPVTGSPIGDLGGSPIPGFDDDGDGIPNTVEGGPGSDVPPITTPPPLDTSLPGPGSGDDFSLPSSGDTSGGTSSGIGGDFGASTGGGGGLGVPPAGGDPTTTAGLPGTGEPAAAHGEVSGAGTVGLGGSVTADTAGPGGAHHGSMPIAAMAAAPIGVLGAAGAAAWAMKRKKDAEEKAEQDEDPLKDYE